MAKQESPSLLVLTPDHRLYKDPDPDTQFMLVSYTLRLAYTLTDPLPIQSWSRDDPPGGQPDPPTGEKVWFKTGNFEQNPREDVEFWSAKDAYFTHRRNLAVSDEMDGWNRLQRLLKIGAYIAGGAFLLSAIFAGLRVIV